MTRHNVFLTTITLFMILYMQLGIANEQTDLEASIRADKPSSTLSLAKRLDYSVAKYGNIEVGTYYNFKSPKEITLLGFSLDSCVFTLFNNEIGHISTAFKGDENSNRLIALLTESLGEVNKIGEGDETIQRWLGKNKFFYELTYADYNKTYYFSISNDAYRELNKAYNSK